MQRLEEGGGSPRIGATGGYKVPIRHWKTNSSPLKMLKVLLIV